MPDPTMPGMPGDLWALVEELVNRVELLQSEVLALKARGRNRPPGTDAPVEGRLLPTDGDPVDIAVLAEWVIGLQVRYASDTDWLKPCWWRHGLVVEELAALRGAWLAEYGGPGDSDPFGRLRWHDEAERCRERVRKAVSLGPGCTAVTHAAETPVSSDPRWTEELAALNDSHSPLIPSARRESRSPQGVARTD